MLACSQGVEVPLSCRHASLPIHPAPLCNKSRLSRISLLKPRRAPVSQIQREKLSRQLRSNRDTHLSRSIFLPISLIPLPHANSLLSHSIQNATTLQLFANPAKLLLVGLGRLRM